MKMQHDEALAETIRIVTKHTDRAHSDTRIDASTHIFDDLGVFSLNFVEIVLECEERFHVSIPDDALGRIQTIGDFTDAIASRRTLPHEQLPHEQRGELQSADNA